jgi:TolB-like protein/predicted Ser/Thr protein kinase
MLVGVTLGPYRVLEKIGEGGMGEVYKAIDPRLNRFVALKVLSPELATAERLQRFEQEARAASALNHPNILTIHDVGLATVAGRDVAFFAMEWVDGRTLREMMTGRTLPLARIVEISSQVADGLAKAHAAGIVHRDLKPENVMVTSDGLVKIVDFGVAKIAEDAAPNANTRTVGTISGVVMGTVGYMSPEQASGRAVDYRSDQFALGLLIYELATGKRPFDRPTAAQSMAATIEADPAPIESVNPGIPPYLASLVARCLAKDPAGRYESTRDLARDLKSPLDTGISAAAPTPSSARRRLVGAAVAIAIAGALAGMWFWRRAPSRPPESRRPVIAVRPFRSLSPDATQAYFAAGMTEEIRGRLSQISSVNLLSRNALDANADVAHAVRDVGLTQLVDGSIRVDGRRVRITAELVDATTQRTLWSDQYDRELADMLSVQSDVALQIARALRANLSKDEQQRLGQRPTSNPDAYALYLRSQTMLTTDRAQNLAAVELLRKALAIDPQFAAAQARIGFRLVFMGYYDDASYVDRGIAEAEAALRLNPSLPAGHFVLGTGYAMKGMDAQARVSFLRALELDPNNTGAMANLSIMEGNFGRIGESIAWARRMFALSGKQGNDFYHVAVPLINMRADEVLKRWLLEGERRFPEEQRIQTSLAVLDIYDGNFADAQRRVAALAARLPDNEEVKLMRADVAYVTGSSDLAAAHDAMARSAGATGLLVPETIRLRRGYVAGLKGEVAQSAALLAEAERAAQDKIDRGDRTPMLRVELAAAAVLRGDHAAAGQWLERAFETGYRDYGILERDPILAKLEPAAKRRQMLDRMKRDVDAQRAAARDRGLLDVDGLLTAAK